MHLDQADDNNVPSNIFKYNMTPGVWHMIWQLFWQKQILKLEIEHYRGPVHVQMHMYVMWFKYTDSIKMASQKSPELFGLQFVDFIAFIEMAFYGSHVVLQHTLKAT